MTQKEARIRGFTQRIPFLSNKIRKFSFSQKTKIGYRGCFHGKLSNELFFSFSW